MYPRPASLVFALAMAAIVATCGTSTAQAGETPAAVRAVKCPHPMTTLLDRLTEIDTDLEGGISFLAYDSLEVSAKTAYNRIPFAQVKADCLFGVGIPAENALNKYIAARNTWHRCIVARANCKRAVYNGPMQRFWKDAHRYLQKAINNLAD